MSGSKNILIVGGGVIGLSTAYYAAQRGHRATVIERGDTDQEGCSFGNAGLISPSHFVPLASPGIVARGLKWMWNPESPFYIKPRLSWGLLSWGWKFHRAANSAHVARSAPLLRDLHLASRACFEELAALPGNDFGLAKKGLLVLCKSEHGLREEARTAEMARRLGLSAQVLTPEETTRVEPALRMDVAGSVYFSQDCHLSPQRFMTRMRAILEKIGVMFRWSTEVIGWRVNGDRIAALRTTRGDLSGDECVLCGGSWSPSIARGLGVNLPMQAGKGYSLTLSKPPRLPSIPTLLSEARVAVTPLGLSLRFGGTMEIAGLDESITPARVRGIIKSVPRYLPEFTGEHFRDVPVWCGLRPCSPDGLPYVGRTRRYSNLAIATGHAMMGLSLGPITGKLMSEILCDEAPSIDITLLNPDRYD